MGAIGGVKHADLAGSSLPIGIDDILDREFEIDKVHVDDSKMLAHLSSAAKAQLEAYILRELAEAKLGWANEFIKKVAYPGGDEGPEWARGWNAYRNKALAEKAKLKDRLARLKEIS